MQQPDRQQQTSPLGNKARSALAAGWAVFVFVMYIQHQMALHWDAIQSRVLQPLLDMIR